MGEKPRQTVRFRQDNYDAICEEERKTGNSKSKIINQRVRAGYNGTKPSLMDSIIPVFGQGLFVAGFIVALIAMPISGVGMALFGLSLMIGAKVDEYAKTHDVKSTTALIRVLGA